MDIRNIDLTKEQETLLITLYAKGGESRLRHSLLQDTFAAEAVRRIQYDFARLKVTQDMMIGLAMRARMLDDWTKAFIAANAEATVLHLGCGLDSRVFRVNPPPSIRWFDIDFPQVAELRRRLYPERDGYRLIGSSVIDLSWLAAVPTDRPAMIVAEGLLVYLREEEIHRMFQAVTVHVPNGEFAFDAFSRLGMRLMRRQASVRATGASLHWGIDDPRRLEAMVPKLRFVEEIAAYDPAELARFSVAARIAIRVMLAIPTLRRIGRFLRYRF